ncbi:hypothetical protein SETIT_6G037300v2 [Setaria italica]|uniref:Zinc finger GRF-type domain-containing protein n=1 Tax=Setaria italica TaxID=4555 RepID=A0A368RHQ8_SETIT|nr:hypothetical protein SETIT_6G037300v2 [Setaria italica]
MSSWRDDQNGIPLWNEHPKCHCGFRASLQVWEDRLPRGKKGCRYFKCPNIDYDFKACTFMEWIDTRLLREVGIILVELETKGQYHARHTEARETACLARLEQERRICQQQIRLKGKEDELQRQREQLGAREAALKRQEEEFEARQAQLLHEDERQKNMKKQDGECSSKKVRMGKLSRFTQ